MSQVRHDQIRLLLDRLRDQEPKRLPDEALARLERTQRNQAEHHHREQVFDSQMTMSDRRFQDLGLNSADWQFAQDQGLIEICEERDRGGWPIMAVRLTAKGRRTRVVEAVAA